jgi:hypothetical protein
MQYILHTVCDAAQHSAAQCSNHTPYTSGVFTVHTAVALAQYTQYTQYLPTLQAVSTRPLHHSAPSPPLPWTLVRGPTSDKAPQYLHTLTLPLILSP